MPSLNTRNQNRVQISNKKIICTCTKTGCVKKYCACFSNGIFYDDCQCENCENRKEFFPKNDNNYNNGKDMNFLNLMKMQSPTMQLGICNCTKSNCTKKYCECYKSGRECSWMCRCVNCANCESRRDKIHCERYLISAIGIQIINNIISLSKREVAANLINNNINIDTNNSISNENDDDYNTNSKNKSHISNYESKLEKNSIENKNVISENKNVEIEKKNEKSDVKEKEKKVGGKNKKNKKTNNIYENIRNTNKKLNLRNLNKKNKIKGDKYKSIKKERINCNMKNNKQEDIYTPMKMSNKKRLRNIASNFKTKIYFCGNLTTAEKTNKTKNNGDNKRRVTKGKRLNM